jgi:hypothetical protein
VIIVPLMLVVSTCCILFEYYVVKFAYESERI